MTHTYTVTAVKTFKGHEGEPCAQGYLCRDGGKVAEFSDSSYGGQMDIRFFDVGKGGGMLVKGIDFSGKPYEYVASNEEKLLVEHCAAIPPTECEWKAGMMTYTTVDIFIGGLVEKARLAKSMARAMKTKTVFKLRSDKKDVAFRTINIPFNAATLEYMRAKFGADLAMVQGALVI